jgi:hypothetical protein
MRTKLSSASALLLATVVLIAADCKGDDTGGDTTPDTADDDSWADFVDADGDGVTEADGDCDDQDPNVFPGNAEVCDGLDDNCNGLPDEGFPDTDGDGTADCVETEECDGLDNDGDGTVDEGYEDSDGDGTADCVEEDVCDGLDNDGDGLVDEGHDADGDGYTWCGTEEITGDCDDDDYDVNPGAEEVEGDERDNDCDGLLDEGDWAEGDLVIVEVLNNPENVSDAHGEWFEVYNTTDRSLYLNGVTISSSKDGDYHTITSDEPLLAEPGALLVLGNDGDSFTNGEVHLDYVYADVYLSNETDDIILMAGDVLLDMVSWDDGATMPDESGSSMLLDRLFYESSDAFDTHAENDKPENWCVAQETWGRTTDKGTPGEGNGFCFSWDYDGDGYELDEGDCDDLDATVYPGAVELDPTKDNDCDGLIEWAPTAVADYDAASSSLLTGQTLYLYGADSFDPEGATLSYAWVVSSVPSGSGRVTTDLVEESYDNPTFTPDIAGDYEFTLTVNDGGSPSLPASVLVTITDA